MTDPTDSTASCTVARAIDVVRDRWTVLILRDAFYGVRRFQEFVTDLGIARNVLTDRLNRLVEHGVLERRRYEDRPPRDEYRLTDKGRDLLPVLLALMRWGDTWLVDEPDLRFRHRTCGEVVEATLVCGHCKEPLERRELELEGPAPITLPVRQGTTPTG